MIVISRKGSILALNGRKGIENVGISIFYQWMESHRQMQFKRRLSKIPNCHLAISNEKKQKTEKFKKIMRKAKLFNMYSRDYKETKLPSTKKVTISE